MAGVFAGGDIVTGAATVIQAMGAGRKAAQGSCATSASATSPCPTTPRETVFGIAPHEHLFVRLRVVDHGQPAPTHRTAVTAR